MSFVYDTYVIWHREMMRYKRNVRYVIAQVFFPLLLIIGVGFGFNNIVNLPSLGVNYVKFLSSGVLVFFVASGAMGGGFNVIDERMKGFLKVVIVAPVSRMSIILGKVVARATFSTLQVAFFLLLFSFFTPIRTDMLWLTIVSIGLMAALFVCFGIALASMILDVERYQMVSGFILFPIYFLSGVFFPVTTLPVALQLVCRINPLTYAVDLFRYSVLGVHEFSLVWDGVLLAVLSVLFFIAATILFDRKFRE